MTMKWWRDDGTRLFLIEKGEVIYLDANVQSVLWPEHGRKRGRVVLKGRMPQARDLLDFPDGAKLSVLDGLCRDPHEYLADYEIMHFDDCRVARKWIAKLGSDTGPGEIVYLRLSLDCEIEVR